MDRFDTLTARCLPFPKDDVDTDQIIPARFLVGTEKAGFGQHLFADCRNEYFSNPMYQGAQVLVARHNFGCGSSREHAPWALRDYGFRAVLAISFADIFYNNALKNFLLPVALPETVIDGWLARIQQDATLQAQIDLEAQQITLGDLGVHSFAIDPFRKHCLLNGVDEIGYTLSFAEKIQAYETQRAVV